DVREQLAFIVCRQEGGASYMAEAYGKLTGEPGVLFVTRGPGATNGAIGVHTGFQDSTPMVVSTGQVPNEFAEREAFQEIDYRRMYGQMAKWVAQIDRVERIPEYVSHAFHTAMAGRPGPVVLALPEDTLFSQAAVADVPRYHTVRPSPSPAEVSSLRELLLKAQRPFVLIGGGGWSRDACLKLQRWIEAAGLPVGTSFRCQDLFDNRSPSYAGDVGIGINPKLAQRVKEADASRHRRAAGRDDHQRLHLARGAGAAADAGPRSRRRRGARARLSSRAGDQFRLCAVCPGHRKAFLFEARVAQGDRIPAAKLPGVDRAAPDAGKAAIRRGDQVAQRAASRGHDRRRRRRQFRRLAAPALPLQGLPHPARIDQR